jgi:hypothetical protein
MVFRSWRAVRRNGTKREFLSEPGVRTPDPSRDAIIACSPQLRGTPTRRRRQGDAALSASKHDACQIDKPLIHRDAPAVAAPDSLRDAAGLLVNLD